MIKLHPSEIHFSQNFLPSPQKATTSNFSANATVPAALPKLQVFKKSGCYFALDNNALRLYRDVEAVGGCGQVDVELVPSKVIPKAVMAATTCCSSNGSVSKVSAFLAAAKGHPEPLDSGTSTISVYSSGSEAGSDCEDSDEDCFDAVDDLTCVVCTRKFRGVQELTAHQVSKKHFGCYACGDIYATSRELKQHKETMQHFSDAEDSE